MDDSPILQSSTSLNFRQSYCPLSNQSVPSTFLYRSCRPMAFSSPSFRQISDRWKFHNPSIDPYQNFLRASKEDLTFIRLHSHSRNLSTRCHTLLIFPISSDCE